MPRPDWYTFVKQTSGAFLSYTCGDILQTIKQVRNHWQCGHFDMPDNDMPDLETAKAKHAEWHGPL